MSGPNALEKCSAKGCHAIPVLLKPIICGRQDALIQKVTIPVTIGCVNLFCNVTKVKISMWYTPTDLLKSSQF